MARLVQSGFELNSLSDRVEVGIGTGSPSISSTIFRSGAYSLRCNNSSSQIRIGIAISTSNSQGPFYARVYVYIASLPSSDSIILSFRDSANTDQASIRLTTTGTLQVWNEEDVAQIGSDSSALSTGQWYRIELGVDATTLASTVLTGRVGGVEFATGSANFANGVDRINFGVFRASVNADVYFDDFAVNDATGSNQNSWPGSGKIVHIVPNATGDNSSWSRGGSDSGANYGQVDDGTPNDSTDYISSNTLDQIDDYNLASSPGEIGSGDTINVVAVGVRHSGAGASANATFVPRIKASASGTVEEGTTIAPASTTWASNVVSTYPTVGQLPLVTYDLPGASSAPWTKSDLDAAQIGARISAISTNAARISTMWMSVDYTPASNTVTSGKRSLSTLGIGL